MCPLIFPLHISWPGRFNVLLYQDFCSHLPLLLDASASSRFHVFPCLSVKDFFNASDSPTRVPHDYSFPHVPCSPCCLSSPFSHLPLQENSSPGFPGISFSNHIRTVSGEAGLLVAVNGYNSQPLIYLSVNKVILLSVTCQRDVLWSPLIPPLLLASGQNPQLYMFKTMNWGGHAMFIHLNINLCIVYAFKHKRITC